MHAVPRLRAPAFTIALLALPLALLAGPTASAVVGSSTWTTGGYDLTNSRNNSAETTISPSNVAGLHPAWTFTTAGDVSATPAVDDMSVYFPDSGGYVYGVDRATGQQRWRASGPAITGIPGDYARATPAIAGNALILGDQGGKFGTPGNPTGAYVFALNKNTGALLWRTQVDSHFTAIVTQSAQVKGNTAFVGVASNEEAYASQVLGQGYVCCSFRGSALALNVNTGAILWKTYMAPPGYSGSGVWGSTPAYDAKRDTLYVSTGNNYSVPAATVTCLEGAADPSTCLSPADHFDSIVALNASTGAVRWATRALSDDVWNVDCGLGFPPFDTVGPNCPISIEGPDFDFGQAPTLMSVKVGGKTIDTVSAGQKAGIYWMLNRDTGAVIWNTQVGPGGTLGGLQWGSAQDGKRIYVADSNSGALFQAGFWAALDPATGAILWQTADPSWAGPYTGYSAQGMVSSANGVVYACTLNYAGTMYAMDAATGQVRWSFDSGGSCLGGAAISKGTVFWGSGYRVFAPFTRGNNKLYAFTL
jgi:polyvinyl alcohol dehydrogenase (cytochrome)